jgi:hypothetical protein
VPAAEYTPRRIVKRAIFVVDLVDGRAPTSGVVFTEGLQRYRSLFPHVSAAIKSRNYPLEGDTIQYIYTDSKHNNPLCRVTPIEYTQSLPRYDKEKYKEMILDAAETVLGLFGFDRTIYSNFKRNGRKKWYEELREQRVRDIETEVL